MTLYARCFDGSVLLTQRTPDPSGNRADHDHVGYLTIDEARKLAEELIEAANKAEVVNLADSKKRCEELEKKIDADLTMLRMLREYVSSREGNKV